MNNYISDFLAQYLITLPNISKASGCIAELKIPKTKGIGHNIIPVANLIYSVDEGQISCDRSEDYTPMIPDSQELGVAFFEDLGSRVVHSDKRLTRWRGQLRLITWLNMKKIGSDNGPGIIPMAQILSLPRSIPKSGDIHGGIIKIEEIEPKNPGPFSKYDLNEDKNQFLIYPYDSFSYRITYTCITPTACTNSTIVINPLSC